MRPTQQQVEAVFKLVRNQWVATAKAWWTQRKVADPSLSRWDLAIDKLMFKTPTALDIESLLCEQGNRQRHALAYATTTHRKRQRRSGNRAESV